jgi:hypothetical protein
MNRILPSLVSAAQKISLSVGRRKPPMERIRVAKINHREAAMELERTPGGKEAELRIEKRTHFSEQLIPGKGFLKESLTPLPPCPSDNTSHNGDWNG